MDYDLKTKLDSIDSRLSNLEKHFKINRAEINKILPQINEIPKPIASEAKKMVKTPVVLEHIPSPLEIKIRALFKHWPSLFSALFLLLSFVYFINYSFTYNWFTNTMREICLLIASSSMLGLGIYLRLKKKRQAVSQVIICLGCCATLLTLWAGCAYYQLYSETIKLISIFTVILGTAALAYKIKDHVLLTFLTFFASWIPIVDAWNHLPNVWFSYYALIDCFSSFFPFAVGFIMAKK